MKNGYSFVLEGHSNEKDLFLNSESTQKFVQKHASVNFLPIYKYLQK